MVEYDPAVLDEGSIQSKIEQLGYGAQLEARLEKGARKTAVLVGGMTCAACVRRVENALQSVPGVENATVNLASSRATIVYSPRLEDWTAIRGTIEQAGYEYLGVYQEEAGDPAEAARLREIAELRRKVAAGRFLGRGPFC
jgi:Cu+-exporting ATPase